ncbi:hypothetical protein C8R45DRAFT_1081501 [Mycena sanguinolenta]|nr:hypothetical protein C8R45DRAFT_1081501 [Mycena sanguinolenta]
MFSPVPACYATRNARLAPPSLTCSAAEALRRPKSSLSTVSSSAWESTLLGTHQMRLSPPRHPPSPALQGATLPAPPTATEPLRGSKSRVLPATASYLIEKPAQSYPAFLLPRRSSMLHGGLRTLPSTFVHGCCPALEDQPPPPEHAYSIVLLLCILCVQLEAGRWDEWRSRVEADGGIRRKDACAGVGVEDRGKGERKRGAEAGGIDACARIQSKTTQHGRGRIVGSPAKLQDHIPCSTSISSRVSQSTASQALRIFLKGVRNPPHLAPSSSSCTFHVGAARVSHPVAALSLRSTWLHTASSPAHLRRAWNSASMLAGQEAEEGRNGGGEMDGGSSRRDGWAGRVSRDSEGDACDGKFRSEAEDHQT